MQEEITLKIKTSTLKIGEIFRPYNLEIILFAIISLFFIIISPDVVLFSIRDLLSDNTITKIILNTYTLVTITLGVIIFFLLRLYGKQDKNYDLKIIFYTVIPAFLLLIWSVILINPLFITPDISSVIKWSNIFMTIDKSILGVYPAFFMYSHYSPIFEKAIILTYQYMAFFVFAWTVFLISTQRIKEFILWSKNILLALAICFPLWIVFPAIQPLSMYVANIFNKPIRTDISKEIAKGPPSKFMNHYSGVYTKMWIDSRGIKLSISNFPSMHAIWGLLLLYSAMRVFRSEYLRVFFLILAIFNMFGAVYTLQHYAVDILSGIIIVLLVNYLTTKRLASELK